MIFSDGHVHIHDCHSLSDLLNAALNNFRKVSDQLPSSDFGHDYVLWLTESNGVDWYGKLFNEANNTGRTSSTAAIDRQWSFCRTDEATSIVARHGNEKLILIAGKQIVSEEKLEILALGSRTKFPEKAPFRETLDLVLTEGAMAVIPWGFGKWLGRRGAIVEEIANGNQRLFFGDNGGRPTVMSKSKFFAKAESNGIFNLPGSDPLPFRSEYSRVGSFGWYLSDNVTTQKPASELLQLLNRKGAEIKLFGHSMNFLSFLKKQIAMQIINRLGL